MNTKQIAAEAWKHFSGYFPANHFTDRDSRLFVAIIQAAIEEATQEPVQLLRSVHNWFMKSAPEHYNGCGLWIRVDDFLKETKLRAAHASEPDTKRLDWLDVDGCANIDRLDRIRQAVFAVFYHKKITIRTAIDAAMSQIPETLLGPKQYPAPENELGDCSGDASHVHIERAQELVDVEEYPNL